MTRWTAQDIAERQRANRPCGQWSSILGQPDATSGPSRKRSKYGAVPTVVDGIRFDSKKEARRYQELKMLEKAGEIWELELQPEYPLVMISSTGTVFGAAQALAGTRSTQVAVYRADFRYFSKAGRVVEDVKSPATKTAIYRLKKKMTEAQYGIVVTEV